jgi:hypothetical protein
MVLARASGAACGLPHSPQKSCGACGLAASLRCLLAAHADAGRAAAYRPACIPPAVGSQLLIAIRSGV